MRSICQLNSKTNCGSILQSKAAYVFGGLSWSEVGLFYFGGGFLALCFSPTTAHEGLISPLWGVGGATLLYICYSVYYQAFVAKKWCVLCLVVQALFALEVALSLWSELPFSLPQSLDTWAMFSIAYLIIPVTWVLLKPTLIRASQTDLLIRTVQRMKFDPQYLRAIATQQRFLPPIFEEMKIIKLGNPLAVNTLVLVSNPTCASCRQTHLEIERLLETNADFAVQIILAASTEVDDLAGKVVRQVLSLPMNQMAIALHYWFMLGGDHFADWSKQTGGSSNDEVAMYQQTLHLRWLELADVTAVPTMFLNATELPKFYAVSELTKLCAFFLPMEQASSNKSVHALN